MNEIATPVRRWVRSGSLLAITLLFAMVWGVSGIDKVRSGIPPWFADKFGKSLLATVPGLTAAFWILTIGELLGFVLALVSLARLEFTLRKGTAILQVMLTWSLFLFAQLSLGQWLTADFNSTYMLFMYFCGTLVALHHVMFIDQETGNRKS